MMNPADGHEPLIEAQGLVKHFQTASGFLARHAVAPLRAVDGIDFTIRRGETLGLVGESGCGKSTTGRLLLRLIEPSAGVIRYAGRDLRALSHRALQAQRRELQMVFQDPFGSLNPRMTIAAIIAEPLVVHAIGDRHARARRVTELLALVGLAGDYARRYPHEFSGGQRQRIGIARALALRPKFIVCDEPVSALDVSIQAQIVNLLRDLQREFGLTYLFISHNLSVVRHIADRVAVMYLGKLVEVADKHTLYHQPRHPYTRALLSAIPLSDPAAKRQRSTLPGDVPNPLAPPSGCRFHPRCPLADTICREREPALIHWRHEHQVACHFADAASTQQHLESDQQQHAGQSGAQ